MAAVATSLLAGMMDKSVVCSSVFTLLRTAKWLSTCIYIYPPGQRPRKTWPFNFAEKDLLLLDEDLLLLGPFGSKVKVMAMDVQQ